jgi:Tfp pilus assembly protein FimV
MKNPDRKSASRSPRDGSPSRPTPAGNARPHPRIGPRCARESTAATEHRPPNQSALEGRPPCRPTPAAQPFPSMIRRLRRLKHATPLRGNAPRSPRVGMAPEPSDFRSLTSAPPISYLLPRSGPLRSPPSAISPPSSAAKRLLLSPAAEQLSAQVSELQKQLAALRDQLATSHAPPVTAASQPPATRHTLCTAVSAFALRIFTFVY